MNPHFGIAGKNFIAKGTGGRLWKVFVRPVDVQTLLAGQLDPANIAIEEELMGNSIENFTSRYSLRNGLSFGPEFLNLLTMNSTLQEEINISFCFCENNTSECSIRCAA